jgi:hypothetical protein
VQIHATDEVEGVPLLDIRALFRQGGLDGILSANYIRRQLHLTKSKTDRLIAALRRMGLLEPIRDLRGESAATDEGQLSKDGVRLRGATAAKPLRRETADRLLSELLDRITALNSDRRFLARVRKAVAFGSYIGNADRIGDLDIAIQLVRREPDFQKHTEANNRRVTEEFARGRRFDSILDQVFWWQREAMLFLRDRRRGLSLQDYAAIQKIVDASPHRVVFQESRPSRGRTGLL